MNLKGLKVTVVGIGCSGLSAALFLKKMGATVYATDNNANEEVKKNVDMLKDEGIEFEIGGHTESFVRGKDLMVISPGVDKKSLIVKWAKNYHLPIISELELGYLFCKGKILAVTGTNGKTTTTTLMAKIIKDSGKAVILCGNIGTPFISEIQNITADHIVVLEVSSFQLEWIDTFKPHISVILNITDDHMDRYKDFDEYKAMKNKIFMNQENEDYLILNYDDLNLRDLDGSIMPKKFFFSNSQEVEGIFIKDKEILLNIDGEPKSIFPKEAIRLKGVHNLDNVMASALACKLIGIDDSNIVNSISSFSSLPHRFQYITEIEGVEFINDSKATNVDAVLKALLSLDRPAVLIAGGRDKEGNFNLAKDLMKQKVHDLVLIGEAKEKIRECMKEIVPIHEAKSLKEAVEVAYRIAKKGDAVLLSPMCTSFDMFKDYAERGEVFINAVMGLKEKACAKSESQF